MKRRLLEIIFSAAMVIGSLLLFLHSSSFPPPLQPNVPGPSFFPKIILAFFGLLCLFLLFENLIGRRKRLVGEFEWHNRSIAIAVGSGALYLIVMPILGYMVASFLYLVVLLIGRIRTWPKIIVASFCSILFMYLMFEILIKIDLPKGLFGI
jgi:putative tricarboxylic transport membrane protein